MQGECVGIIGDNGSGKSTLLKIIANILRPTKGTVNVKGKMTPFLELGVGFQPDLTVRENIGVYATVMGLSRREIDERIDDVIEFAGLREVRGHQAEEPLLRDAGATGLLYGDSDRSRCPSGRRGAGRGRHGVPAEVLRCLQPLPERGSDDTLRLPRPGSSKRFCDKTLLLGGGEQRAFGETEEILDKYVYGAKEASLERKEAVEKDTTSVEPKRWGDKKVSITDVKFLDKFGGESGIFSSFDPMTIRIFYNAPSIIRDPVFGIALYTEQIQHLYGTNTELKNITIDQIEGEGYIDLEIESIPMLSGRFLLTVAVHTHEGTAYDWIDKQYSFNILPAGRDVGIFEVPCRWVA